MTPSQRRWVFLAAMGGLLAFYLWGLLGLPAFGHYPGPYGDILNAVAIAQTHATDIVSAVNFDYRSIDTVGEEFILFAAATGTSVVLRHLREERETDAVDEAHGRIVAPTSDAVRLVSLGMTGPTLVLGWYIVSHGQVSPGGGFQGGIILASAFLLVYLAGQFIALRRISPVDLADAVEAVGAGSFVAVGVSALALGAAYLTNVAPLGTMPGSVDSSGTIALISFFVGVEVTAAFVLIVAEMLEQTLIVRAGSGS
ncbi:MAG: MnhB domain-containing protein [Acidimicrobiales bacterium]